MTEKQAVYFVLCASHRLCINNHRAYPVPSAAHMTQARKGRLCPEKPLIPGQACSKEDPPPPISCHLIFPFLPLLIISSTKKLRSFCRKTTYFKKSSLGLKHLPEQRSTTLRDSSNPQHLPEPPLLHTPAHRTPEAIHGVLLSFLWRDVAIESFPALNAGR